MSSTCCIYKENKETITQGGEEGGKADSAIPAYLTVSRKEETGKEYKSFGH